MNVRTLTWLFVLGSLLSCVKDKQPEAVLTQDQMVEVMIEIYLAEARTTLMPVPRDSAYRLFLPFQDSLLHRKGIADSTLKKSYTYYLQHPKEMEAIYDAIIDSLSLREQRLRESPHFLKPG